MKAQLLKLLTACSIILVMISPALLVWWRIWQYHCEFVTAQQLVRLDDRIDFNSVILFSIAILQRSVKPVLTASTGSTVLGFAGSIPLGFLAGLLLSDRYQIHRHTTLRQQVAILEKLWQQNTY